MAGLSEIIMQASAVSGLVKGSVDAISGTAGMLTSLKKLLSAPEKADDSEIKTAFATLSNEIADAKIANADLKIAVSDLLNALYAEQERQDKLARYELWETPAGTQIYRLREEAEPHEPAHFACPKCYQEGKISILQPEGDRKSEYRCRSCPLEGAHYAIEELPPHAPVTII